MILHLISFNYYSFKLKLYQVLNMYLFIDIIIDIYIYIYTYIIVDKREIKKIFEILLIIS